MYIVYFLVELPDGKRMTVSVNSNKFRLTETELKEQLKKEKRYFEFTKIIHQKYI